MGAGSGLTVFLCSGSGDGLDVTIPNPTSGYQPGAFKLSGMTFRRTNSATGGNGIFLSGSAGAGNVSLPIQLSDIVFESLTSPTGMWSKCLYSERINTVSLFRVKTEQYAAPCPAGDFICINLAATDYSAGWILTECTCVGGRYGLDIGSWFQGINLVNCEFITEVPVHWPGGATGATSQGFSAANCYFSGVSCGILLQNSSVNQITGCEIQQFGAVDGVPASDFVGFDFNGNQTLFVGNVITGASLSGHISTSIRFNNNNPSSGSSGFDCITGNSFLDFDVCFAFQGVTTISNLAGNSGQGNSGSVLYTGTIGTNTSSVITGPNLINTNSAGSPEHLSFNLNITDHGDLVPIPGLATNPSLGTSILPFSAIYGLNAYFANEATSNIVTASNAIVIGGTLTNGTINTSPTLLFSTTGGVGGPAAQIAITQSGTETNTGTISISCAVFKVSSAAIEADAGFVNANSVSWTAGGGVPTFSATKGALRSRVDGPSGSSLYVCQGGTVWTVVG